MNNLQMKIIQMSIQFAFSYIFIRNSVHSTGSHTANKNRSSLNVCICIVKIHGIDVYGSIYCEIVRLSPFKRHNAFCSYQSKLQYNNPLQKWHVIQFHFLSAVLVFAINVTVIAYCFWAFPLVHEVIFIARYNCTPFPGKEAQQTRLLMKKKKKKKKQQQLLWQAVTKMK